jgi:glucokinase
MAKDGDKNALYLWEEYRTILGRGVGAIINAFDPDCVVIGGGVSSAWELFSPALLLSAERNTLGWDRRKVKIIRAKLRDRAALYGGITYLMIK